MIETVKKVAHLSRRVFIFQQVRFILTGGLSTVVHWSVMALMISIGAIPGVATAIGAIMGAITNYILQHRVTFQSSASHRSVVPRFIAVCVLTWFANLFIFLILHHIVLLSPMYAQGITTLVVAFMSYFLYKRVVFNDR